jgi:hypothetical protein
MLNSKKNIALFALVAMLAIAPGAARAANCGGEPSVSSASSFQTWRRWCSCMGGTSASNLNDAQRQGGCRLPSGSGSFSSSAPSGDSIGTIIGTEIGKALSDALFGNPETEARRRAEERARAEEQRRAAEEMNRKQEEQKNRLLGGMMGVDGSPPLGLMDIGSGPELGLMTDSASTIAPSAKAVPPAGKKSSSYTKGFEHASQCISQNAGSACAGVTADQQPTCVADYRGGYDSGSIQKKLVLQEAYQAGQGAAARGELANAASNARALGPCRTDWIVAYNNGYGVKAPLLSGTKPAITAATKDDPEAKRIINEMTALARRLGWSAEEQDRLATALKRLGSDGDQNVTDTQIRRAWQDVLVRGQDGDIARKAAQGDGPGLSGAGKQSFEDCTIFALANASGLPYSVVAARATKLISEGEWRDAAARANPQKAIERKGLIGGEVVMLAEAFGQAEVVPSSAFAKTLKQGRPVMVNVVPQSGNVEGAHEVVLTKAFQHGGETWYEMVDSNQGAQRRLYLSSKELSTMLQENGVAFRPEPGTTTKLLR